MSDLVRPEWCNGEVRKQLILRLKDSIKDLMPYIHQKEIQFIGDSVVEAVKVCEIVEIIFFHGLKVNEYQQQLPLWSLLEKLEVSIPINTAIRNTVGAVACVSVLRTPLGKARAWIRQSLNTHTLEDCIMYIHSSNSALLRAFYDSEALIVKEDDFNLLLSVIRSLKVFPFNFQLDVDSLNYSTPTISRIIHISVPEKQNISESPVEASVLSNGKSRFLTDQSSNGNSFDGFLKSLESGFDRLIVTVDSLLSGSNEIAVGFEEQPKKLVPLFGSHLKDLLLDERRCQYGLLNPELGIPNQILKLINFVHHSIQTPNLFRQRISAFQINELKKSLEMEQGIPQSCNIATVSFVLIQWLNQLPEPLLGFDHYSAILACSELEDPHHRIRNLSLLILETQWYNKPLLLAVLSLLHKCLLPENMSQNNLNHIAVSVLCTPFLLRPPYDKPMFTLTAEEIDRAHMAATAAGSHIVEFLVAHYEAIFSSIKEELQVKQTILTNKCLRIRNLQESLSKPFDISSVLSQDTEKLQLVFHLWNLLAGAEKLLSYNSNFPVRDQETAQPFNQPDSASQFSFQDLLLHLRWELCGLKQEGSDFPLREFNVPCGALALLSFVSFFKKYDARATNIVSDFQLHRRKFCRLPQVLLRVTHFTADALFLFPPTTRSLQADLETLNSASSPIQYISKTAAWPILSEEKCFQELFDIGLLCFDEAWKNLTERIGELPSYDTFSQALFKTRAILWDIMSRRPQNIQQIWELWTSIRLMEEEKLFQLHKKSAKLLQHHGDLISPGKDKLINPSSYILSYSESKKHLKSPSDNSVVKNANLSESGITNNLTVVEANPTRMSDRMNDIAVNDALDEHRPTITSSVPYFNRESQAVRHYEQSGEINEYLNASLSEEMAKAEIAILWKKSFMGITTNIFGGSKILLPSQIDELEEALPATHQCYDWKLVYRLSLHGASLTTLLHKAQPYNNTLLVVKDSKGAVFGALITEQMKFAERDKYYGNGTIGVWSFSSGALKYYSWSFKNSYFMISSKECIAFGGGGNFALFLDSDLNHGTSGSCQTFQSPCLASEEEFQCHSCELFAFQATTGFSN